MKKLFLCFSLFILMFSAYTSSNSAKISSLDRDFSGTYLGSADYGKGHKGLRKPAVRIYFQSIEGESNKYNVILLEYVNLLKMAPSYIASNKLPFIAKHTGLLKNITSYISVYEAVPGKQENTYELWPLIIANNNNIIVNKMPFHAF